MRRTPEMKEPGFADADADSLFVVNRGRSFALRRRWDTVFEAGSRAELELKAAAMDLEVDWASKFEDYSIWPARRTR